MQHNKSIYANNIGPLKRLALLKKSAPSEEASPSKEATPFRKRLAPSRPASPPMSKRLAEEADPLMISLPDPPPLSPE